MYLIDVYLLVMNLNEFEPTPGSNSIYPSVNNILIFNFHLFFSDYNGENSPVKYAWCTATSEGLYADYKQIICIKYKPY